MLSPSHFKGPVASPEERIDSPKPQIDALLQTDAQPQVLSLAEVKNIVVAPTSEISKPQDTLVQGTIEKEDKVVATGSIEAGVIETSTISEVIKSPVSRPPIQVERPERKVSGLSLKSIQLKQKMEKDLKSQQPDSQNLPTDPFEEEALIEAWKEYTQQVEKAGKHILFSHLTMGEPRIEGELIHLIFPNNTIRLEVEREQGELLGFIKKKLNNYNIDISIEVNEEVAKKYAYTTREKFDKLNQKNPLLDKLRQTFDLDL